LLALVTAVPTTFVWWLVYETSQSKSLALEQLHEQAVRNYLDRGLSIVEDELYLILDTLDTLPPESHEEEILAATGADAVYASASFHEGQSSRPEKADDEWVDEAFGAVRASMQQSDLLAAQQGLSVLMSDERLAGARLPDGRWLAPLAMHLATDIATHPKALENAWNRLRIFMADPESWRMPHSQRRFYWHMLEERFGNELESVSRRLDLIEKWRIASGPAFEFQGAERIESIDEVTLIRAREMELALLFQSKHLQKRINALLSALPSYAGGRLSLSLTNGAAYPDNESRGLPLPADWPQWEVVYSGATEWDSVRLASRETLFLVSIGVFVFALSLALSFTLYRVMRRQSDLAQLKNDLVATVSHELKTPVSSIKLLVDVLQKQERWDEARGREYLELITRENNRLGRLIENFLSFSRMERGKDSLHLESCPPMEIAEQAAEVFKGSSLGSLAYLTLRQEGALEPIAADRDALQTAIGNLLENAAKYGGDPPKIELAVVAGKSAATFRVSDNGMGIAKEERGKIFDRFYQSKRRLSEHAGGVGLGLSIVSFIAMRHRGKVRVDSEIGKGSAFEIEIPNA